MSCREVLVALENIIIDKVSTVPTARNRKIGTSAPMEMEWRRKMMVKVREKKKIKEL